MFIDFSDFQKIDIRVGTILKVEDFPKAKNPSYKVWIDFGEKIGIKKTSAQITKLYKTEELIGKQILAVINFSPRQIADFMSECLLLGSVNGDEVVIISPERKVENGSKIF